MPDQLTDLYKHKCSKKDLYKVKSDRCETPSGTSRDNVPSDSKTEITCKCGKCFQLNELVELYQKDGSRDTSSKYKMAYLCLDCKFKYDPNRESSSLISYQCTPVLPKIENIETILSKQVDRGDNLKILDASQVKVREAAGGGGGGKAGGCGTPCKCPTCKCENGGKGGNGGGGKGCGKSNCNCDPCGGGKKDGGGGGGKEPLPCNCTDCKCEPCKDPSKAKKKEAAGSEGCKCGDCCKCKDCEYKKGDKKEAKEEAPCTCKECTCPVCTKKKDAGKDKKEAECTCKECSCPVCTKKGDGGKDKKNGGECTCKECSCPVCTKKGDKDKAPPNCPPKPDVICDCEPCNCLVCPGAKKSKPDCSCPAKLSESKAVIPAATSESKKSIKKPSSTPSKAQCVCQTCICIKCPSGNVRKDDAGQTSDNKEDCEQEVPEVNAIATPMSAKKPETANDPCDTEAPPGSKNLRETNMGDCEITNEKPAKHPKNPERNFGDSESYHKCSICKNLIQPETLQPINHPQLYMCSLCTLTQPIQKNHQKPTDSNEAEEEFFTGYCTYCSLVKISKRKDNKTELKPKEPTRKWTSSFLNFAKIPPFEPPQRLVTGSESCACCLCAAKRAASSSFEGKPPAYHSILKMKSSSDGRTVCKSRATETEESKRKPRKPGENATLRKVFVKKEGDFNQTFSNLAFAYDCLLKKGKAKDEMITGLSEMLKTLGASSTKESLMRCSFAGSAPDYDRCRDSTSSLQSKRLSSQQSICLAKRSASLDRIAQQSLVSSDDIRTKSSLLMAIKTLQKQYEKKDHQIKKAALLLHYVILMNKLSENANFTKSRTKEDRRKESTRALKVPFRSSKPYIIVNLEGFSIVNVVPLSPDTLVVEWSPPDTAKICGYDVLIDGKENHMIMNGYRTCTLVEGIDLDATVSIAVYAVTVYGRCEPPATATFEPHVTNHEIE